MNTGNLGSNSGHLRWPDYFVHIKLEKVHKFLRIRTAFLIGISV